MADSPPPPPPPPPAPTTITALSDDLLLEIFLRLPAVTSLARAAFTCRTFLRAVRSSPAFRRRFRELRAPPLLALFLMPDMRAVVPAGAGKSGDIAAAFDGLLQDSDASESEWRSESMLPYGEGYASFVSRATNQCALYNPHSQILSTYPMNLREGDDNDALFEFHMLSPDGEEQWPSQVICVHLYKESQLLPCIVDPYIMVRWPSSLINGKENSETGVKDDGRMGTEEGPPVLFTALQSFNEKMIDDGNSNFAKIDSFLLDDERNSLLRRIATLESGLAAARDRVLRIHTESNGMNAMELTTSVSELAAARDRVLRIGTESDSLEGMERVSCWQMCKVMLSRACSWFFTG